MQRLHQLCRDGVGGLFAVHKHEGLRGLKLIILLQFYDALLGGPWDLGTTYNWDYNPTYNWGNPLKSS